MFKCLTKELLGSMIDKVKNDAKQSYSNVEMWLLLEILINFMLHQFAPVTEINNLISKKK